MGTPTRSGSEIRRYGRSVPYGIGIAGGRDSLGLFGSHIRNIKAKVKKYSAPIFRKCLSYTRYMAWTPPIDRRKNKELLSEDRFYRLLSKHCKYVDRDTLFHFYMGLVQVVAEELKQHKVARLPHLGDFGLVAQKRRVGWAGPQQVMLEPREVLRFYPKERFRRYFNKLNDFRKNG